MDDPIGSHPTRGEQLDILASIVADNAAPEDRILDFGCGTGYVAKLIFDSAVISASPVWTLNRNRWRPPLQNLAPHGDRFDGLLAIWKRSTRSVFQMGRIALR